MKEIFTVGTGTRTIDEFIEILKFYRIENVVDVRRFPTSKRFPHFKRENLEKILEERGFRYFYMGDLLGGFREGGYEKYLLTQEFLNGLNRLIEIAEKGTTLFFCAETLPWRCHRRFIARELQKHGWDVRHIIKKGEEMRLSSIP